MTRFGGFMPKTLDVGDESKRVAHESKTRMVSE